MRQITEEIQQQERQPLSEPVEWMTVRQVQERTGMRLNTIHVTLWRAQRSGAPWVKREGPEARARLLINTASPEYCSHEERWLKMGRQGSQAGSVEQMTETLVRLPRTEQEAEIAALWTPFCHELANAGLVIYRNTISDDDCWRWRWGTTWPLATPARLKH